MFLEPRKTYNYIEHIPAPPRGSKASNSYFVSIFKKMVSKLRVQSSKLCVQQSLGGVVGYHASLTH